MTPEASEVRASFVAAYPFYVRERVAAAVAEDVAGVAAAIEAGTAWLDERLAELLSLPFSRQPRGPLEVFQDAMRFPTTVLSDAGVPSPDRSPAEVEALPGDRYGLAPASSQDLGERAWKAHLAWGIAKARAVAGAVPAATPTVVVVGGQSADRQTVRRVAGSAGFAVEAWDSIDPVDAGNARPVLVLVDVDHPAAHDAIRGLVRRGHEVAVFGSDVDDLTTAAVLALGARDVIERRRLEESLARSLPRQA